MLTLKSFLFYGVKAMIQNFSNAYDLLYTCSRQTRFFLTGFLLLLYKYYIKNFLKSQMVSFLVEAVIEFIQPYLTSLA